MADESLVMEHTPRHGLSDVGIEVARLNPVAHQPHGASNDDQLVRIGVP